MKIKRDNQSNQLYFRCPGCKHLHAINDAETYKTNIQKPVWEFNGDFDKPTIRASILVWGLLKNSVTGIYDIETDRCHSFITDGNIQFLSDCYHDLAGKTVELPELD